MIEIENIRLESSNTNYPIPITIDKTEKILKQMKECVCRIYSDAKGTGFFTKIENMPVLITNYHVLTKEEINTKKEIKYSFGQDKKIRFINYKLETRKIYENKDLDFTIIEIKTQDKINENNFLEIEIEKDLKEREKYSDYPIYILGYPNIEKQDDEIYVSYGIIKNIKDKIYHLSNTDYGSSGSPILSLKTCKIIGYHYASGVNKRTRKEINLGSFIEDVIDKIFNESKHFFKKENQNLKELTLIYNLNNSTEIKIFGKEFVKNNKNNFKIIFEEQEQEISEYLKINNDVKKDGKLKIKFKEINKIENMSHLFSGCLSLTDITGISEFITKYVTNVSNIFNNCSSLKLPDKLNWETNNITDMSFMFRNCSSLESLPDISNWNTKEVTNIKGIFSGCKLLKEIPDISKWKISKVTNMKRIFSGCSSLKILPDISYWDTKEVKDMGGMFTGCSELEEIKYISEWDTGNVEDMSEMFSICTKLSKLPDIYKWNTSNVKYMRGMFSGCQKLESILIYKWDTKNVVDMSQMFINCKNLKNIEDIYKLDVTNVKNLSYMFYGCENLSSLPNISKWNVKGDTSKMFDGTKIRVPLNLNQNCTIY